MASGSTFGRRLRALRMTLDMSQVELARRIGRHQTAIGPYERDEYEPPRDVVEKLALVLETSPEYLYFGRSPTQIALPVRRPASAAPVCSSRQPEPTAGAGAACATSSCVGYRVRDDSMAPVFRPRQIVLALATAPRRSPAQLLGPRCPGRARRRAHAVAPAAAERRPRPLRPCRVQCARFYPWSVCSAARSIVGVLWPDAWRESDGRAKRRIGHIPYG